MPQRTLTCHLPSPRTPDSRRISPQSDGTQCPQPPHDTDTPHPSLEQAYEYSDGPAPLARGEAAQTVEHTHSRRTGPRRWRTAVEWLIAAGLHPRASATTLRVAEDLADRMDYDTGHVRYCLDEMAARLVLSRASVKRHVKYLRELGALAWVVQGTRKNIRRALGLGGYAATATVYAATIPATYDHAKGHTIVGSGYRARIIIDRRNQQNPVDNPPVDNPSQEGLEPPSLTVKKEEGKLKMVGGSNYTSQARPPKNFASQQSTSFNGRRRTAADVQKASKTTRMVRALVNWTQSVPLRRLEYVLRPWTDRGWDALRIADELHGMCSGVRWKPRRPDAFIRAQIAKDTAHEETLAQAVAWEDSTAYREMAVLRALLPQPAAEPEPERTDEDRTRARLYGWDQWEQVAADYDEDPDDALDLYGKRLCSYAVGRAARLKWQESYA